MLQLYHQSSFACSKRVTELYSTSFSLGIKALHKKYHDAIYGIYGFVRYADEIVDTFHAWNKEALLNQFRADTYHAIDQKISLNPVLHAFQLTYHTYQIDRSLVDAFLHSMEMDLHFTKYKQEHYAEYIYGSAEVVGLMCLKVFCNGDEEKYTSLKLAAKHLGAAFQKVNFLRDMQSDFLERGRMYFPNVDFENFCEIQKEKIEQEIEADFALAYEGILQLPKEARFGVYLAYKYYFKLFRKIKKTEAQKVIHARIRVNNFNKLSMLAKTYLSSNVLGIYIP
jgi:phytoene/squalene synthetase